MDDDEEDVAEPKVVASTKSSAKPEGKLQYHKVKRGESLGSIADTYGVTIDDLKEWNNLSSTRINAGKQLKVYSDKKAAAKKEGRAEYHTVRRGETLSSIAAKYGVSINDLKEWNDINGSSIAAGQKLAVNSDTAAAKSSKSKKSSKKASNRTSYKTHKVKSGETLGEIAERNGTTASAIRRANGIKGSNIRAGQTLKIPR